MRNLKVALLQIMPEETLEGNLQKGLEYCRKAKDIGADIAYRHPEKYGLLVSERIEEPFIRSDYRK